MQITETNRLRIRRLTFDDAPFVLELLNDPDWLRFIGDKKVKSLEDARDYIAREPLKAYRESGFGLNLVELKDSSTPIGICGLKKRDGLDHPDLGFAFLPAYRGNGLAFEACEGVVAHEHAQQLKAGHSNSLQLLAITTQDNSASMRLLEKLNFGFARLITLPGSTTELRLYAATMKPPH